jgi:hypothetical protein
MSMMSYPHVFSSAQPDVTYTFTPADFALFDHQPDNSQFSQTTVDQAIEFGNTLQAGSATWSWLDALNTTPASSSLLQNYAEIPTSTAETGRLNPMAQPFEKETTMYQPVMQDGFISFNTQAQIDERRPTDKMEELASMFANFQARTEQRMTLIEKEILSVKSR